MKLHRLGEADRDIIIRQTHAPIIMSEKAASLGEELSVGDG